MKFSCGLSLVFITMIGNPSLIPLFVKLAATILILGIGVWIVPLGPSVEVPQPVGVKLSFCHVMSPK
jgi:hypothetical protein